MSSRGLATLLLVILVSNLGASCSKDDTLVDYLVSVVKTLAKRTPGVHQCVFFGTQQERPFGNTLGAVLQDSRLDFVTRSVITGDFQVEKAKVIRYPMVMLMEGELIKRNLWNFVRIMICVKPNTKTFVLITKESDFKRYERYLKVLREHEVVFIDVKRHRMIITDMGSTTLLNHLLNPRELYGGILSSRYNLRGKPLRYSHRSDMTLVQVFWTQVTAENVLHPCHLSVHNVKDLCYWKHLVSAKIDIDLTGIIADGSQVEFCFENMVTSIMIGDSIAVPRSALNMVQLFTMPFNWEVWTTLTLILGIVEILSLLFPSSFRNDPILLVLCGYEKYDLHRAGRREKFLLMPMIVLMFFATSAYESKLLSMMASKPASKEIRTLEELVESGIKIKVDLLYDLTTAKHPIIKEVLVNGTVDFLNLDMIHAYFLQNTIAKLLASRYYDPDQRIHRYVVLDESYTVEPIAFVLGKRSPLKEVFEFTLTMLVESGLYNFIEQFNIQLEESILQQKFNRRAESDAVLYFADFRPVWIVFALGVGVGVIAFVSECVMHVINTHSLRIKTLKTKN